MSTVTVLSDHNVWLDALRDRPLPEGLWTISPCGCVGDYIIRSTMEHRPGCPWLATFHGGSLEWDRTRPKVHEGILYRWAAGRTWFPDYAGPYNYLCVCQFGHSRSVAMARVLQHRGIPAVACGWANSGPYFLGELCRAADYIIVMEASYASKIPPEDRERVKVVDVGRDRWSNPMNPDLNKLCEALATKAGILEAR